MRPATCCPRPAARLAEAGDVHHRINRDLNPICTAHERLSLALLQSRPTVALWRVRAASKYARVWHERNAIAPTFVTPRPAGPLCACASRRADCLAHARLSRPEPPVKPQVVTQPEWPGKRQPVSPKSSSPLRSCIWSGSPGLGSQRRPMAVRTEAHMLSLKWRRGGTHGHGDASCTLCLLSEKRCNAIEFTCPPACGPRRLTWPCKHRDRAPAPAVPADHALPLPFFI